MIKFVACLRTDAHRTKTVSSSMQFVCRKECELTWHLAHRFWVGACVLLLAGCASKPVAPVIDRDPASAPVVKRLPAPVTDSKDTVEQRLERFARVWEGVRYRLGGNDETGIDCSALSARVYQDLFSKTLPRTTSAQLKVGQRVGRAELRPGDLIFFNLPGGDRHVGVYVGDERFLHASESRGVMTSSLESVFWRRYYFQATRPQASNEPAS